MPALRATGSLSCDELVSRLKAASWPKAIENLREEWSQGGEAAAENARRYADTYAGRRAVMVFDCVMSRRRTYERRVVPLVAAFADTRQAVSLRVLADEGPGMGAAALQYPFQRGEAKTIQGVAVGLVRFCDEAGLDEEDGVRRWAEQAAPWERGPKREPYVGSVKGIGIATFAYLRMRCGADAIKPDVRVNAALGSLLFPLGDGSDEAVLCVAGAAAAELEISRLELDQLLWWMERKRR